MCISDMISYLKWLETRVKSVYTVDEVLQTCRYKKYDTLRIPPSDNPPFSADTTFDH